MYKEGIMELTSNERTQIKLALSDYDTESVYDMTRLFESMDSFEDILENLDQIADYFKADDYLVDDAFDEGREEGYEDGREEGYDTGYDEGYDDRAETLEAVMEAIQSSADALDEASEYSDLEDLQDKVIEIKNDLVAIKATYED